MNDINTDRKDIWDAFLQRWPLQKLADMQLVDYCQAGNQDSFVYWLEAKTGELGSIWGGSSFKFGVYSRKDKSPQKNDRGKCYDDDYGWMLKYGTTPDDAFRVVRGEIVKVAQAARAGDLAAIDSVDLGIAVKWKIAFLYQDQKNPCLLPIYKVEYMQAALDSNDKQMSRLQQDLMVRAGGKDVLEYGDIAWAEIKKKITSELSPEDTRHYFEQSDHFAAIKPASKKVAGYETSHGQQLAVILDNKQPTLFLNDGAWFETVKSQLQEIAHYSAGKSRNSNLAANAPKLALGNAVVKVVVPNMSALIALCDAYEDVEAVDKEIESQPKKTQSGIMIPLNQILYGPPGTGKTYATIDAALDILSPDFLAANQDNRETIKEHFDNLVLSGHIRFVTFHQSFSYEDFVEGLRAENGEDGQLRYEVVDGVFKALCNAASAKVTQQTDAPLDIAGRRIWKMSLGNSQGSDAYIYDECIENGYALLGYGGLTDFSDCKNRDQIYERIVDAGKTITNDAYDVTAVNAFVLKMKVGDLIVVTEGNSKFRAIGEVTGEYRCLTREDEGDHYGQCRNVKWLRVYKPSLPLDQLMHNKFSQMTLYELRPKAIDMDKLVTLLETESPEAAAAAAAAQTSMPFQKGEQFGSGYKIDKCTADLVELIKPNGKQLPIGMTLLDTLADYVRSDQLTLEDIREKKVFDRVPDTQLEPYLVNGYSNILPALVERVVSIPSRKGANSQLPRASNAKVLIIDEINRGNVSRIFGELITLIEPSKRAGMLESLNVTLPYSKESFSVPANLYLIGTMNTADRSLAGLDIALRRRFSFREMPPRPDILDGVVVEGVNVGKLLRVMNERIELLFDRDHCLGHAYFMTLKDTPTIAVLGQIFQSNILPLLQEYFFEDWQRIQWVLNDHRKPIEHRFVNKPMSSLAKLFGDGVNVNEQSIRWSINVAAFGMPEAYAGVIDLVRVIEE